MYTAKYSKNFFAEWINANIQNCLGDNLTSANKK